MIDFFVDQFDLGELGGEFIRSFLIHALPKGFHRIRHYGLLASGSRADNLATMRILIAVAAPQSSWRRAVPEAPSSPRVPCGFRTPEKSR